jgi:hypothetical protein
VASLELPLAVPEASPVQIDSSSYYKLPVRAIYKSYPVYPPNKEPAGYFEWLERQEPEIAFDPSLLKTKEDWIRAGRTRLRRTEAPPLYTNNKLTPAPGFKPPADHARKFDITPVSVGTNSDLTLKTRRGTGYYKVPSRFDSPLVVEASTMPAQT